MKKIILIFIVIGLIQIISCSQYKSSQENNIEVWKLGWRMIGNSIEEKYELASLQFDSLRNSTETINRKYLVTGLEAKSKVGKTSEISEILKSQDEKMLQDICGIDFLSSYDICEKYLIARIKNKELQLELIRMYIDDQAARGNLMKEMMLKYNIDSTKIFKSGGVMVDERNRSRLKEIFSEYGFPTKELVGKDAMYGVFLMIQHSDGDKDWQKSQLPNIENAVKSGDLSGQSYAYLYDRIQVNSGKKQLYGTQFAKVDPINKIVELAETDDLENLDIRRMNIGIMPIEMYKRIMLKNL